MLLLQHLEKTKSNAAYISRSTQNEIIDCSKEDIQSSILNNAKEAEVFFEIFDKTTDVSASWVCHSAMCKRVFKEDYITFVNAYDLIRPEDIDSQITFDQQEASRDM